MITRFNPIERFRAFDRFNQMMDEMLGNGEIFSSSWLPAVDVKQSEKELTFVAELPGIEEKDISVQVVGDLLTIAGHRELQEEERKEDFVRIERSYGSFQRSFTLDAPVNIEDVKASFRNGVLTVTVPKTITQQPQKVLIQKS